MAGMDFSGVYLIIVIFVVLLAILWICLPFAVFGIKDRLDRIIKLLEEQNARQKL